MANPSFVNQGINWGDEPDDIAKTIPFENMQEIYGLFYYIIPEGMKIFRGDNSKYNKYTGESDKTIPDTPTFYTTTQKLASEYGIVFKYETTKPYELLALDIPDNLQRLYDNIRARSGSERILTIINKQYGLEHIDDHGDVLRDTKSELDKEFVAYLCSMQRDNGDPMFEGYATNSMKIPESGNNYTFHEELVICNPRLGVQFREQITQGKSIQYALSAEAARNQMREMGQPRKSKIEISEDGENVNPNIGAFGFGSPPKKPAFEFGSPTKKTTAVTNSYRTPGGNKRKTQSRKTKSKKIRKNKHKTNKKRSQNKYNKSK
jgi:hypothetical protein